MRLRNSSFILKDWQKNWTILRLLFTNNSILNTQIFVRSVFLVHLVAESFSVSGDHKRSLRGFRVHVDYRSHSLFHWNWLWLLFHSTVHWRLQKGCSHVSKLQRSHWSSRTVLAHKLANKPRLTIMANSWIFIHNHWFFNTLHAYSWKNIDDPWQSDAWWIFIHDCHPWFIHDFLFWKIRSNVQIRQIFLYVLVLIRRRFIRFV